jgi:hypothetical protein
MPRCPIVRPEVVRVPLADGDFLDLKKQLNTREYRSMLTAQFREPNAGDKAVINLEQMGVSKVLAYVVGWSFVDFDGHPLPFDASTLMSIHHDVFTEILAAVEAHEEASEKARAAEKNGQGGETKSLAISPSLSGVTGVMSGSPN